jgi:tetratricopeptide (TPR) repeat protein
MGEAYENLGLVCYRLHETKKALEAFKEAVKLMPTSAQAHFNLGMTYLCLGDRNSALAEYTRIKGQNAELAKRLYRNVYKDKLLDAKNR